MTQLGDLAVELRKLGDIEPIQHAVGLFGKDTALDAVAKDLGRDRQFSNWKRPVALGAGYDLGNPVVLNLRPAGLWFLAEDGRKRRGTIKPRRGSGKLAVMTPQGPRRRSTYSRSRGLSTITDTLTAIDRGIVRAAEKGRDDMIRKAGF